MDSIFRTLGVATFLVALSPGQPGIAQTEQYDGRWTGRGPSYSGLSSMFIDVKNGVISNGMTWHVQGSSSCCITGTVSPEGEVAAILTRSPNSYTEITGNLMTNLLLRGVINGQKNPGGIPVPMKKN